MRAHIRSPLPFILAYSFPVLFCLSFVVPFFILLCLYHPLFSPRLSSTKPGPSCLPLYPRSSSPQLGVVPRSSPCLFLLGVGLCALNIQTYRGRKTGRKKVLTIKQGEENREDREKIMGQRNKRGKKNTGEGNQKVYHICLFTTMMN